MLDHVDVWVERLDRGPGRGGLGDADPVGRVDHLALEVGSVDHVVVHEPDRADAGRGEVERGRRAEPARAEQEDLGVEESDLPVDPDLGQKRVARVAVALLGREALRVDEREAGFLPGDDPAFDDRRVLVAELAQEVGDSRGAVVGAAVKDQALGRVRGDLIDPLGDLGLRNVDGAFQVGLVPLVLLAHVDDADTVSDLSLCLCNRDHLDPGLDVFQRFRGARHLKVLISVGIQGLLQKV